MYCLTKAAVAGVKIGMLFPPPIPARLQLNVWRAQVTETKQLPGATAPNMSTESDEDSHNVFHKFTHA